MVRLGYITAEESAALGFDPAERARDVKAATERYKAAIVRAWFVITHEGSCVVAQTPDSPADLIQSDLEHGLEDDVDVEERDGAGKPAVVRVGSPRGDGLSSVIKFYRGLARCEISLKRQQDELHDLR